MELEKIIALMKKRIDHLQADNQSLKGDLDRQRATVNRPCSLFTLTFDSLQNDSNRAFFTQATESTKEIEQMGNVNSRVKTCPSLSRVVHGFFSPQLQKEVALLREQVAHSQVKAMPPSPSSSNNGY